MFLKKYKFLAALLLFVFAFVYFGATACMAIQGHACCSDQGEKCPIIGLQKTPRSMQAKSSLSQVDLGTVVIPLNSASNYFQDLPPFDYVDFYLPKCFLLAKINHPPTAPPIA
ncbi:MAG: hypothetical protein HQ596_01565 [Candidatus Saganbacteria bacterium]|nr:hypothetical protein [Candidatus Saganbacteria bacterium]